MNRQEFLEALAARLASIPETERERSLAFYIEIIDDRIENGASEEEAVASLGPVEKIAGEILQNAPAPAPTRTRKLRGWEIALLILGLPLWLPLLVSAAVVALAMLIVLWSLIVALWAMAASFTLGTPMTFVAGGLALFRWNLLRSTVCVGMACAMAGAAILLLIAARYATRRAWRLTRVCWMWIRRIK